ncbi:hypothetical protein QR680_017557 [Steinernema hermaphroditum]|uniref:PH domain-containing protein n=1 Tax=Steinernema hermaphroditum TaxID=289476 RepID=A0AA39HH25_9BILA|nr:hypothetical protein QR680_017557 [Steinernema hermaphroditum]
MISRTTVCSSDSDDFEVSRGPTPLSAKKRSLLSLESLGLSDFSIAIHSRSPFDCAEFHSDVAFHIVKEMLCGEWTTQNELRLVNEHYFGDLKRSAPERCHVVDEFVVLLAAVQTGAEERTVELEHTVRNWKDSSMAIGNVLLCLMHNSIPQFRALLAQMPVFVAASHQLTSMHGPISDRIRALDAEGRLFFVDILWTVVRLAYKTVTWQNSLGRLVECFLEVQHMALGQTRIALEKISAFNRETEKTRENVNDYVKLIQLEQILNASRQLVQPNRKFVREGFAQVITAQGAVPSMVVLFRDSLLLASACTRRASRTIDFSVDSHIPLREITYEDKSSAIGITHCGSPLLLSFASEDIQRLWMRDLDASVRSAKEMPLRLLPEVVAPERKVVSFADSVVDSRSNGSTAQPPSKVPPKALEPSSKAPFLSCWLRQKTISAVRQNLSVQRQLSGYLFRRRSVVHEWQLLWAQISGTQNLMLYLSHTDLKPLAIIDLIGCFVGVPSVDETVSEESEEVGKNNYLFKVKVDLQQSFIFRVESRHDLVRWITEIHESSSLDREPGPLDPLTMLAIT